MPKDHRAAPQRYARLLHSTVHDPRFSRMSLEQRGAWLSLLLLQDAAYPACLNRDSILVTALLGDDSERVIDELIDLGMLDDLDDREFDVHGIDHFHVMPSQTPEAVRDRVAKHREQSRMNGHDPDPTGRSTPDVTGVTTETDVTTHDTTRHSTTQDEEGTRFARASHARTRGLPGPDWEREGLPHITPRVQEVGESLTGRGILTAGDKTLTELDRLVEDHGDEAVAEALKRTVNGGQMTWNQMVWGSRNRLEPIPGQPTRREQVKDEHDDVLRELTRRAAQ